MKRHDPLNGSGPWSETKMRVAGSALIPDLTAAAQALHHSRRNRCRADSARYPSGRHRTDRRTESEGTEPV